MPSRSASEYSAMLSLGVTIDYFSASRGLLVPHTGNGLPATGAWHRGTGGSHECKDDRRRNNTRSVHNTAPRHSSPQSAERSTVESAAHAPLHRIHRRGIDDTCRSRPAPTSHHSPTAPSQPPASHPRCPPSLSTPTAISRLPSAPRAFMPRPAFRAIGAPAESGTWREIGS